MNYGNVDLCAEGESQWNVLALNLIASIKGYMWNDYYLSTLTMEEFNYLSVFTFSVF